MGSRATIIVTLFAVEIALFSAIIYFLGGGVTHAASVDAGGDRVVDVLDAGSAPHVIVSDPDSRVMLSASNDGRVHVTDHSLLHGLIFSGSKTIAPVRVTRTADGVKIERSGYANRLMIFGFSTERIEIAVPAQSTIDVTDSSGTNATGLEGALHVHSHYGHIALRDLGGTIDAQTDDGYIEAVAMHAANVSLDSKDGHIGFDGTFDRGGTYTLHTADGRIRVNAPGVDALTIHAVAEDGSIRVDGRRAHGDDGRTTYDAAGNAGGKLTLDTQSGSITINSGVHAAGSLTNPMGVN